jgi:prepilin-type N-terminal cleavage/methylation domain-containing protein
MRTSSDPGCTRRKRGLTPLHSGGQTPFPGGGFTLIELLAVIVVLAVLAGAAVPAFTSLAERRSGHAARLLQRDLTYARQRAIATGTRSWVVFDINAETWSVLAENPSSPGRAGATVITDPATGRPFTQLLGAGEFVGVEIMSAAFDAGSEVGFTWLGEPLNSSQTALTVNGQVVLTGLFTVTVARRTGFVEVLAP